MRIAGSGNPAKGTGGNCSICDCSNARFWGLLPLSTWQPLDRQVNAGGGTAARWVRSSTGADCFALLATTRAESGAPSPGRTSVLALPHSRGFSRLPAGRGESYSFSVFKYARKSAPRSSRFKAYSTVAFRKPSLSPGVVARAFEEIAVDRPLREKRLQRVGDLDLAALVGGGVREDLEDVGRQDVPADDRVVRGSVRRLRFLDHAGDGENAVLRPSFPRRSRTSRCPRAEPRRRRASGCRAARRR